MNRLAVVSRGAQGSFVHHVREVRAGEARRTARHHAKIDVFRGWDLARVHREHFLASAHIRPAHNDSPVKSPGTQQRWVQHVGPVSRGDQDYPVVRLEPVHFHQQLI